MAKGFNLDFTLRKDKAKLPERPERETHITKRPDRVKQYLLHHMDDFVFDEFSTAYLEKLGMQDGLKGVPIPLRKGEDVAAFKSPEGLKTNIIAENMARVIGTDPKFKYSEQYQVFIFKLFGARATDILTRKAKDLADKEEYEMACIYFRAALIIKYNDLPAMYGYARVLRTLYDNSTKEDYIGNLKAESLDYFEMLTEIYPTFGSGWYYLGYMYLNLGLYMKAKIAWEYFLKKGRKTPAKDTKEIKQRLRQIEVPLEIEKGYNCVLSERWEDGIDILEKYKDSVYKDWWPLWYYLGVAYVKTKRTKEALSAFKHVLKENPRHIETMEEIVAIYSRQKDAENVEKYNNKIRIMREAEEERRKTQEGDLSIKRARKDRGIEEKETPVIEFKKAASKIKRLDSKLKDVTEDIDDGESDE